MLHPVNIPQCIEALDNILLIQDWLLEIALTQNPRDKAMLNANFNAETASWLWKYQDKLINPLVDFFALPNITEKTEILEAFRHDITFHDNVDDPGFAFHLQPEQDLPNSSAKIVGDWLQNFYDVLMRWGIPAEVMGINFDLKSQKIYWEFDGANSQLRVCPACDGTWMEKTSTGILTTLDHIFPRSKYPALSVHPINLVPLCETCNSKIKKNRDPLTDDQIRTLPDTFHSYFRPGNRYLLLETNDSRPWSFSGDPPLSPAQASLLPDIVDIPGRWESHVDEIDRMVRRRIKDLVGLTIQTLGGISEQGLHQILERIFQGYRNEWGEYNNAYPATFWVDWLRNNKFNELRAEFVTA